jgi:membrane-associated protease RseP (regulator of RpoE activity)
MAFATATNPSAIRTPGRHPCAGLRRAVRSFTARVIISGLLGAGVAGLGVCPTAIAAPAVPSTPAAAAGQKSSTIHRPRWMGVAVQGIPSVFDHLLGLNAGQGLLVVMVVHGSPAAKAGLIPGDLIIRVNHKKVDSPLQLLEAANRRMNGKVQSCTLRMIRDGKRLTVKMKSAVRPNLDAAHLRVTRLSGFSPTVEIEHPPRSMARFAAPREMMRAAAAKPLKPPVPMTLTRRIDIYGYVHSSITYAGHHYRILPTTVKSLPAPVQQMVKMLMARHVISLQMPPSFKQKIDMLKARIAFLQRAQRQIKAELQHLIKIHGPSQK